MRLLIAVLTILGSVGTVCATERQLVADFKSIEHEHITVAQITKDYGLDLIITKHDAVLGKNKIKRIPNAFGVVLDRPAVIFICWIANGDYFDGSFQIFDIKSFKTNIIKLNPLSMGDELECLIEKNEKYFLIFDNFVDGGVSYIFDKNGRQLQVIKGKLKTNISIEGKYYHFTSGHTFGGFMPNNSYLPLTRPSKQ